MIGDRELDARPGDRARIAEPGQLDGRGAAAEDAEARALREALEVDQNIDAEAADRLGGFGVGEGQDVDVIVHRVEHALVHGVVAAGSGRVAEGEDLEAVAVMRLQHAGEQRHGRVIVEIAGDIADADNLRILALDIGVEADRRGDRRQHDIGRAPRIAGQERFVARPHQGAEGIFADIRRIAFLQIGGFELCLQGGGGFEVADIGGSPEIFRQRQPLVRTCSMRLGKCRMGLLEQAEAVEDNAGGERGIEIVSRLCELQRGIPSETVVRHFPR